MQLSSLQIPEPPHQRCHEWEKGKLGETRMDTWTKRGETPCFRYQLHFLIDKKGHLIRRLAITHARSITARRTFRSPGETVYRDKGDFGVKPRAAMDETMKRAVRGRPHTIREKHRNRVISRIGRVFERSCVLIKHSFNGGYPGHEW